MMGFRETLATVGDTYEAGGEMSRVVTRRPSVVPTRFHTLEFPPAQPNHPQTRPRGQKRRAPRAQRAVVEIEEEKTDSELLAEFAQHERTRDPTWPKDVSVELMAGGSPVAQYLCQVRSPGRWASMAFDIKSAEQLAKDPAFAALLTQAGFHFVRRNVGLMTLAELERELAVRMGARLADITMLVLYMDCTTFSWASLSSATDHRSLEGAPKSYLAQSHTAVLTSILDDIVLPMRAQYPNVLVWLENPAHGSFRLSAPVTRLQEEGWWVLTGDHCAGASAELDGPVRSTTGAQIEAGLFPLKRSVYVVPKLLDPHWVGDLPRCTRAVPCAMKIPGTDRHVRVICARPGLLEAQAVSGSTMKARVPLGVIGHLRRLWHLAMTGADGWESYCERYGDGGTVMTCTSPGCTRVQHEKCSGRDQSRNYEWICDRCTTGRDWEAMGHGPGEAAQGGDENTEMDMCDPGAAVRGAGAG